MNHYYIRAEICEGVPDYDFVLKAQTQQSAENKARKIIKGDYPVEWACYNGGISFYVQEVTPEKLLQLMTLN